MHERKVRQVTDDVEDQNSTSNGGNAAMEVIDPAVLQDELKKRQTPSILQMLVAILVVVFFVGYSLDIVRRHDASIRQQQIISVVGQPSQQLTPVGLASNVEPLRKTILEKTTEIQQKSPKSASSSQAKPKLPDGCINNIPDNHFHKHHIVNPPEGPVTLVCCITTKGPLNIAVHPKWAPLGAARFLDMVTSGFFSSRVPLFRALQGFLVQFGLAGDPQVQRKFDMKGNLRDDPPWLPLGPPGRMINGVKRFQKGYMAYAGGGPNTRDTQLILAFEDSEYLAGGSPWEVPWGQVVGDASYETMSKIYTGYGEAPEQGKIRNRGAAYIDAEFPLIDYVNSCLVVKEGIPWKHTPIE